MRTARANFAEADIRIVTVIDSLVQVWKLCRSKLPSQFMVLKKLPRAVYLLQSAMDVFAKYSPSKLKFPKFHMLKHLASSARLFGPPWLQTTEFGEANHKPLKASVCHTSFNAGYQEHAGADYLRRQELLRIEDELQASEKQQAAAHSDDSDSELLDEDFGSSGSDDSEALSASRLLQAQTVPLKPGKVVTTGKGNLKTQRKTLRELLTIEEKEPRKTLAAILRELFGADVSSMAQEGPSEIKGDMKRLLGLHGTISDLVFNFVHDELKEKNRTLWPLGDDFELSLDTVLDSVRMYSSATLCFQTKADHGGGDAFKRRIIVANSSYGKKGDRLTVVLS